MPQPGSDHVQHAAEPSCAESIAGDAVPLDPSVLAWCPACGGTGREPAVPPAAAADRARTALVEVECWWCRGVGVLPPRVGGDVASGWR